MQRFFTASLLLAALSMICFMSSCLPASQPSDPYSFLRLEPHERQVEVVYYKEEIPQGLLVIDTLQVTEGRGSLGTLLALAKEKAQARGVDGILLLDDVRRYKSVDVSAGDEGVEIEYTQYDYLTFSPFIYKSKIDYLDTYVNEEHVWRFDSTGKDSLHVGIVRYKIDGSIRGFDFEELEQKTAYLQSLRTYDLNHLLHEQSRYWSTLHQYVRKDRVLSRTNTDYYHNKLGKKVFPHYVGEETAIDYIDLRGLRFAPSTQRIYLNTNAEGQLISKHITSDEALLFEEHLTYDDKGRLVNRTLYRWSESELIPYMCSKYKYFPASYDNYLRVNGQGVQ